MKVTYALKNRATQQQISLGGLALSYPLRVTIEGEPEDVKQVIDLLLKDWVLG